MTQMTKKQRQKEEHRIAEKIRGSMAFVMEKAKDIKRCSDYMIADEAADMLGYVTEEIEDVLDMIARAKDNGLFREENQDGAWESLDAMVPPAEDEFDSYD